MVDLPEPEGPTSASVSPGATRKETLQDRPRGIVGEAHRVEHHLATGDVELRRAGLVGHLARLFQQVEHLAHVHQRLPDLAIDRAEEIERHGDLDHEGVDHDEIAHGQRRPRAPPSRP
jgi:hypothetical protein